MYSVDDRQSILEELTEFFNSVNAIRGAVLLGSGTIGFTDRFSDLDFMLAVKHDSDCVPVKNMVLEKLKDMGYSFGKNVEFRERRFIIVAILENFLELDISVVPVSELIAMSEQWKVIFDKDHTVLKKMSDDWNWWSNKTKNKSIIEQLEEKNTIIETTYLLRRGMIALARNNLIYAANLISEIRNHILYVECLIEGKKVHQFKNYASLDLDFKEKITKTYVGNLERNDLLEAIIYSKDLFFTLINKVAKNKSHLKYSSILDQYVKELF